MSYPILSFLLLLLLELLPCTSRSTARAFKTAAESSDVSSAALIAGKCAHLFILYIEVYGMFRPVIMSTISISQSMHVGEMLEVHLKAGIHSGTQLSLSVTHFT
jgi:hypothetical protein